MNARLKRILISLVTQTLGDRQGQVLLPVLTGPARGLRFRFDFQKRLEVAPFLGTHEREEAALAARFCKPGWTVWDCGTYMGYYTALFSRLVGPSGAVVAFEADPRNLERTRRHLALNRLENVRLVHAALGAPGGETEFILSNDTNSHLPEAYIGATPEEYRSREPMAGRIRVRRMSLDQAYTEERMPPPDLIKIDIDGGEREALAHGDRLFREKRPLLLLELHNPECDAAAWEFSQRLGYSLRSVERGAPVRSREEVHGTLLCTPR